MEADSVRRYQVQARSTDMLGRVLCSARQHHFVVDGPAQNGCPGEAVTPAEVFLAGVASCGVELIQVIARDQGMTLGGVTAQIDGWVDREHPVRSDHTVFNGARLRLQLTGVTSKEAEELVEKFKSR
ncbi:MAG: hypothetical protein GEV06_06270 [Luteitalea sp.]|nr:hypothetical protein [Luteitalea sp.]